MCRVCGFRVSGLGFRLTWEEVGIKEYTTIWGVYT